MLIEYCDRFFPLRMMSDVYDGKLRFGCYRWSQKLVELVRLPNSFVCIIGNAHLQKTLRKQLGRNSAVYQTSSPVALSALRTKVFASWREAKGTVPR